MTNDAQSSKPSLLRIIIRMVEATEPLVRVRSRCGVYIGAALGTVVGLGFGTLAAFKKGFFPDVPAAIALGLMGMVILGFTGFFFGGLGGGLIGAGSGIYSGLRRHWNGLRGCEKKGTVSHLTDRELS